MSTRTLGSALREQAGEKPCKTDCQPSGGSSRAPGASESSGSEKMSQVPVVPGGGPGGGPPGAVQQAAGAQGGGPPGAVQQAAGAQGGGPPGAVQQAAGAQGGGPSEAVQQAAGFKEVDRRKQCSKPSGLKEVDRRKQCSRPPGLKEVDRRKQCSKPPGLKEVDRRKQCSKPPGLKEVDRRKQCSKPPGLKEVDRREQCSNPPGLKEVDRRKQCSKPPGLKEVDRREQRSKPQGLKEVDRREQCSNPPGLKEVDRREQCSKPPGLKEAIRDKIASLEATVQRLSGSASTDALRKELLDHATRPAALFDPRKAISMMEALVDTAKGEGHKLVEGGEGAELLAHRTDVLGVMVVAASDDVTGDGSERQYSVKPLEAYMQHLATRQGWVTRKRDGANIVSPSIEMVAQGKVKASADSLLFRDPESFRAGGLHKHATEWEKYLLCRLRQFNPPVEDLLTTYTCFVRPVLEYAAPLWHPGLTEAQRRKIENIQRRATRIILAKEFTNYKSALETLQLQTLEDRRIALCRRFANNIQASTLYRHWLPQTRGSGHMPWKPERHEVVNLTTDASGYKWAGEVELQEGEIECGDYWTEKETSSRESYGNRHVTLCTRDFIDT
ncbi:hypothetical protein Bbelb_374340 [Branchiostoma belcheri]|nr:hypothetical protein Bbelb_374340 [Branchiostoma belcheri]